MHPLYKSFRSIMKRQQFIQDGEHILLALSGGVDSMVMASLFLALRKNIDFQWGIIHVNYGLRGEESMSQENLVRRFALTHGIPCFVTQANLPSVRGDNFQSSARKFRYHYFLETALRIGASKVAVAHHLEDQAETVLFNWLRGSSLKGLRGMQCRRELGPSIELIRPLLVISKKSLIAYARDSDIPYIEDSSNRSPKYLRNRLRHELLPILKEFRPKCLEKIVCFAGEMGDLSDYLEGEAKKWIEDFGRKDEKSVWLPRPRWVSLPKGLRLEVLNQAVTLFLGGGCQNIKRDHFVRCEQIGIGHKVGGWYSLPRGLRFIRKGDNLVLGKSDCFRKDPMVTLS